MVVCGLWLSGPIRVGMGLQQPTKCHLGSVLTWSSVIIGDGDHLSPLVQLPESIVMLTEAEAVSVIGQPDRLSTFLAG